MYSPLPNDALLISRGTATYTADAALCQYKIRLISLEEANLNPQGFKDLFKELNNLNPLTEVKVLHSESPTKHFVEFLNSNYQPITHVSFDKRSRGSKFFSWIKFLLKFKL